MFLAFVKFNHRYNWVVAKSYRDYYLVFGKHELFIPFFWVYWVVMFAAWPIVISISIAVFAAYKLCKWFSGGKSIIPEKR
jgi:hypothetical protein